MDPLARVVGRDARVEAEVPSVHAAERFGPSTRPSASSAPRCGQRPSKTWTSSPWRTMTRSMPSASACVGRSSGRSSSRATGMYVLSIHAPTGSCRIGAPDWEDRATGAGRRYMIDNRLRCNATGPTRHSDGMDLAKPRRSPLRRRLSVGGRRSWPRLPSSSPPWSSSRGNCSWTSGSRRLPRPRPPNSRAAR